MLRKIQYDEAWPVNSRDIKLYWRIRINKEFRVPMKQQRLVRKEK